MTNRVYGWKKQKPDHRDLKFSVAAPVYIPIRYDLSVIYKYPACYDQGNLGSCTANAIAGALEADQIVQKLPTYTPSRLYIYYYERAAEGTISTDSGAEIRDGIKVVNDQGACKETTWPYDITQFATRPSSTADTEASQHKAVKYMAVAQTLKAIQTAIVLGYPVVIGFNVFNQFESDVAAATGVITMPSSTDQSIGGHAVTLVGYDNHYKAFKFRNSWGASWGSNGYGFIPYQYVLNSDLSADFWAIETIQ